MRDENKQNRDGGWLRHPDYIIYENKTYQPASHPTLRVAVAFFFLRRSVVIERLDLTNPSATNPRIPNPPYKELFWGPPIFLSVNETKCVR